VAVAGGAVDLLPNVKAAFDAKKTFRKAVLGMMAAHRLQDHRSLGGQTAAEKDKFVKEVEAYKAEAEKEEAPSHVLAATT